MCTIMPISETFFARWTSRSKAQAQVDELIQTSKKQPVYVWLDRACYGNGGKGFYYVRFHPARERWSTAYNFPALIVKKSKLRPDQVEFMERKCRETEHEAEEATCHAEGKR